LLLRGAVRRLTYSARLPDEGDRVTKKDRRSGLHVAGRPSWRGV